MTFLSAETRTKGEAVGEGFLIYKNSFSYRFTQVRRELTCDQGFRPLAIDLTALLSADQREM